MRKVFKKVKLEFEVEFVEEVTDLPIDLWDLEAAIKNTDSSIKSVKTKGWEQINSEESLN